MQSFTNLAELTRDDAAFTEARRRAFPFFQDKIFLTHASVSPLPQVAANAVCEYSQGIARGGQFDYLHAQTYTRCKERVARLIGNTSDGAATADQVAFCGSTSAAIGSVATGILWRDGDNCVVADGDFPANVIPWKNLRHRHEVETRLIPFQPQMCITLDDVKPLVDERTRVVSLCSANFLSGVPIDLNEIGAWLHQRGVLFCVDAIQTLGAIRFDATHVDFVCADAHKWLLGPNGIAVLWSRQSALEQLQPAILGWLSTQTRDDWFACDTTPINNAERFEPGARNYLGAVALEASLAQYEEIGAEFVENRVVEMRQEAARVLAECDCRLLWNPQPEKKAGIVTFQPQDASQTAALYKSLDARFALSLRQDKSGADWIRVSPHWMNTKADLAELGAMISDFTK